MPSFSCRRHSLACPHKVAILPVAAQTSMLLGDNLSTYVNRSSKPGPSNCIYIIHVLYSVLTTFGAVAARAST